MDRMLTNEEKVKLLETIVLNGSLSEIERNILEIKNNSNIINEEVQKTSENKLSNDIDVASIYAKDAMPLVKDDLESHPIPYTGQVIEDPTEIQEEVKEGPVLKRTLTTESKVPNPWGDSGAKHVTPGEQLDY